MGLLQSFLRQDEQHAGSADDLRHKANEEARLRGEAIEHSKACYLSGDHAGAAKWSAQSKEHGRLMGVYNQQAADSAFSKVNSQSTDLDRIDLHGLFVKEAEQRLSQRISDCRKAGISRIEVIVGKGLHSQGGVPKLKPAILRLIEQHNLRCTVHSNNAGVIWVELVDEKEKGLFGWLSGKCCVM